MNKISLKDIKVVNLSDLLYELQRIECEQLGICPFAKDVDPILPDGREGIRSRVRELVIERPFGNQRFNNDSLYNFAFSTLNGEKMCDDEIALYNLCKKLDVIKEERVVFDTTW